MGTDGLPATITVTATIMAPIMATTITAIATAGRAPTMGAKTLSTDKAALKDGRFRG